MFYLLILVLLINLCPFQCKELLKLSCFDNQPQGPRVLLIGDSVDRNAVSEWCGLAEKGRYRLFGHDREGAGLPACQAFERDKGGATIRRIPLPKFDQRLYVCAKSEGPNAAAAFVFNEMGTDVSLHCAKQYYKMATTETAFHLPGSPSAALWKQCLAGTIVPIIESVRDALGGLDGIVLQSTLWDVALPFEADKTSPLFTGGQKQGDMRRQFMRTWERNMSTFLDYAVPYFKSINGENKAQPWIAWRTINYVHNKTGLHYFNKYGQQILEDMKQVGVTQAAKHGMDILPYHLFPGSHLRRDDVHPNIRSSATLVEYAIRAVQTVRRQNTDPSNNNNNNATTTASTLVPESVKLELVDAAYQFINTKADAKFQTLTAQQKAKQKPAWAVDKFWRRSHVVEWERDIVEARKDPEKEKAVYAGKIHLARDGRAISKSIKPHDVIARL